MKRRTRSGGDEHRLSDQRLHLVNGGADGFPPGYGVDHDYGWAAYQLEQWASDPAYTGPLLPNDGQGYLPRMMPLAHDPLPTAIGSITPGQDLDPVYYDYP